MTLQSLIISKNIRLVAFFRSSKFYVSEKVQENWLSGLLKKFEKAWQGPILREEKIGRFLFKYLKNQTRYQKSNDQLDITDEFQRLWYMNGLEGIWPWPSSVDEFQKNYFLKFNFLFYLNHFNSTIFEHSI